ncbi:14023_t:CDS:2, partial [Dentiscutata erythropus]
ITGTLSNVNNGGVGNISMVVQAPDSFHYIASEEAIKVTLWEVGFKIDPDFSNVVTEISFIMQKLYELEKKGKYPINYVADFRIIKSTEALFATTFDNDKNALYLQMDIEAIFGSTDWEKFIQSLGPRYFNKKYNAKPHWAKEWETTPGIIPYLSDVLSAQIKQFEIVRSKYDPDKMFFDNKSLQEIFSGALGS